MKVISIAALSGLLAATSAFSSPIEVEKRQAPLYYTYDDAIIGSELDYTKSSAPWTHLKNQGHKLFEGTESYTGKNGQVYINNPFTDTTPGNIIRIYSTKKSDRGAFNVYCGKTLIGSGNEYSAGGETDSVVVAEIKNYVCTEPAFVMKNDRGAKYMALDYFGIYRAQS